MNEDEINSLEYSFTNNTINTIGFDADDTLWHNENIFFEIEKEFSLLYPEKNYELIRKELSKVEEKNLKEYGYGIKGFILSLLETSLIIEGKQIEKKKIKKILDFGKKMIRSSVKLLPEVKNTLKLLSNVYTLLLITKGDLLDQERKIQSSNLFKYFSHIEIGTGKEKSNYEKILSKHKILPNQFLMVGNSIKSDILPVLELGAYAAYIPYKQTWSHEFVDTTITQKNYVKLDKISDVINLLGIRHP